MSIQPVKNKLSPDQINEICLAIPLNRALPIRVAESMVHNIREKLRKQLLTIMIYSECFKTFKDEIVSQYYKTLAQAGEAVGVITAQSIGERQTQTTLNSFHSSGLTIKTVVVGVPRFSELLNATKDPKMINCLIFLTKPFESIKEIRGAIGNSFTEITLKRLTLSYDLVKDPLEDWHYLFCEMYNIDPSVLGWRVRCQLNKSALYEYNVRMRLIKERIESEFPEMKVLYTPESVGIIDIFMEDCRLDNEEEENDEKSDLEDEEEEEEEEEEIEVIDNIDNIDNPEEYCEDEVVEEKAKKVKPVKIKMERNQIPKDMEQIINIEDKIIPLVMKTQLSGITNVKEIFFEKRKPDEKDKPDEWVVTTEGSNLYGLFSHPLVDKKRTLCNNMWEIYEVFGIESARQFLIEEFMDVVTSDGTFVNSSHVELLVDLMTYTGSIISISRYGQKKVGSGPLSKASFEESLENFLKAGLNGEKETTDGVSASIMLGKLPKTGTGVFDLKIDTDKLIKNHVSMKSKEEVKINEAEIKKVENVIEVKNESKIKEIEFKSFENVNEVKKEAKKEVKSFKNESKNESKPGDEKTEIVSIKSKKMKKINSLCI